ncbi:G protein-coupled receptor kinase 5 [Clonorchis sinensis]|uniref:G protein-coupled receptor kinase n=1 Tax=Clonorchis sinensis TaxID=79923 RepID=A0A8T1MCI2_CLOSI|nr:G protein-coupled receptor kinase 5 [Clonorchis sinensis]
MELENIVANTVYIKAKKSGLDKDKGRSKKWRTLLAFQHIVSCEYLRNDLDLTYGYIVVQQPIGKRLFWMFCENNSHFSTVLRLFDLISEYQVCHDTERSGVASELLKHLSAPENESQWLDIIGPDNVSEFIRLLSDAMENGDIPEGFLKLVARELEDYLEGEPFSCFLNSLYFDRYLQWKALEKTPVTKHTFRMYRVLGKGGFGEVCACQVRATGKLYACKKLEKKRMKKRHGENMALTEKEILQKVNSPFVVNLAYTFETKDALCLVLTIMNGGDLKFHIHNMTNATGLGENRSRFYAAEIALGLEHMHSKHIVYRDLKPENILIDDQGHVRISDLGLAVEVPLGGTVKGRVGTAGYMAPEVVMNMRYSFSPDWFSYGCLVYEMIMGHAPFRKRKERVKREEVDRRVCEELEEYNSQFSDNAKKLCRLLLQKDPAHRLGYPDHGAEAVKAQPWFAQINWARLEAGLEEPPFTPDPHAVYAKDVLDIEQFSTVKGVTIETQDMEFYQRFCSGAVSIPWQNEMIETECFDDLNEFYQPNGELVENLDRRKPPPDPPLPRGNMFHRLFFRRHNTDACKPSTSSTGLSVPQSALPLSTSNSPSPAAVNGAEDLFSATRTSPLDSVVNCETIAAENPNPPTESTEPCPPAESSAQPFSKMIDNETDLPSTKLMNSHHPLRSQRALTTTHFFRCCTVPKH